MSWETSERQEILWEEAKMMSYEDIKKIWAKHAVNEVITSKRKHGQKHKSAAPEVGAPESEAKVARMIKASEPEPEPEVVWTIEVPKSWRAPVAQMI